MSQIRPQLDQEAVKVALKEFYSINNASRISSIDTILESYLGREIELLEELKKRYKVEFEPFDKLLSEYRVANPNSLAFEPIPGTDTEQYSSQSLSNVMVTGSAGSPPQQKRDEVMLSTRASLSALGIPTLFTEKIINGVNWKGFSIDKSPLLASQSIDTSKKEADAIESETNVIDIAAIAKDTNHPEELLIQIQKSLELNASFEKSIKSSLRKLEALHIHSSKMPSAASKSDKSSSVNIFNTSSHAYDEDYNLNLMAGRMDDSLKMEILALRELIDSMRDFIFETLKKPIINRKLSVVAGRIPSETSSNSSNKIDSIENTLDAPMSHEENDGSKVVEEYEKSVYIDKDALAELADLRKKFAMNWREQDELRLEIDFLMGENQTLKEKLLAKDHLISTRDSSILQLQREIRELKDSLQLSYQSKNELAQIHDAKVKMMELRFQDHATLLKERLSFEQEDILTQLANVAEAQLAWQTTLSQEAQTEILRLRVELAKSRRQEAQRDREVAYLQRQLTEAAKQLAQYVVESEDVEGGNE